MHRIVLGSMIAALLMTASLSAQPLAGSCTVTLRPGDDVSASVARARATDVICLTPGVHRPLLVSESTRAEVTVRGSAPTGVVIRAEHGDAVTLLGGDHFTLADVTLAGGLAGVYAARVSDLRLVNVTVEGAAIGVHIDDGAFAQLTDVTIRRTRDVGLLLRRGATLGGEGTRVLESGGTGVAAVAGARRLALRGGEISGAGGPGLFAGIAGCADLGAATLEVPSCFLADPPAFVTDTRVLLDGVTVRDGPATGIVLFPGVQATLTDVRVWSWGLTGLFAWGATADLTRTDFDLNAEHAVELRAFPDPRTSPLLRAVGSIRASAVKATRPLGGPILGGGILAQGADLAIGGTTVEGNAGIGVSFVNGSTGSVADSIIRGNEGSALCVADTSRVGVERVRLEGNRSDEVGVCAE